MAWTELKHFNLRLFWLCIWRILECGSACTCHVMSCCVMLCYVMLCYVMLCYIISCHIMSCHIMSCHIMSYHVISCHVMSCHVMSCHVMSCHVMSCHVISCHVISFAASRTNTSWIDWGRQNTLHSYLMKSASLFVRVLLFKYQSNLL